MRQKSTRPRRGLSLYMSILSALAIEIFTLMEFPRTVLFFAAWTVVFALLTIWEIIHETKRSRKPEENRVESILPSGQKPLSIIDLDQVNVEVGKTEPSEETYAKGFGLREHIAYLSGLEEYLLVVSFAILAGLNLILTVSVGFFGLVL